MARPREFDTTEALSQAMQVFWSKGFKATSLNDLLDAMGLSKSSFYDTFGSKHEVFLETIEHYKKTMTAQMRPARALLPYPLQYRPHLSPDFGHEPGRWLSLSFVALSH